MTSVKINRFLPIYTSTELLKFGVDTQNQLKLQSGNQKIQFGCQAAIWKVISLKTDMFLPTATINVHIELKI